MNEHKIPGNIGRSRCSGPSLPRRLGNYELRELLGAGGMGEVFLAENIELGELAAVKLMPGNLAHDAAFIARFREEARKMRRLEHGNIVRAYDFGREGDEFYLVMEYIDGGDLQKAIEAYPEGMPPGEIRRILLEILAAVEAAHRTTIHRDLSPNNILLTREGNVKVSDFGLSQVVGEEYARSLVQKSVTLSQVGLAETIPSEHSRRASNIVGKVRYMSPQVTRGEPADLRNDLYALGIIMYDMLTGKTTGMIRPLSKVKPELDAEWQAIFDRCTDDAIADRYQSASEFACDLRALGGRRRKQRPGRRYVALSVFLAAIGGACATYSLWSPEVETWYEQWRSSARKDSGALLSAGSSEPAPAPTEWVQLEFEQPLPEGVRVNVLSPSIGEVEIRLDAEGRLRLPAGGATYTVRLEHPDHQTVTFRVPGDAGVQVSRITMPSLRLKRSFEILSNPSGATVVLGGRAVGATPFEFNGLAFERANAKAAYPSVPVRIEYPGYRSVELALTPEEAGTLPTVQLEPEGPRRLLEIGLPGGVPLRLAYVPAGVGQLGSHDGELGRIAHSEKRRTVDMKQPFYAGIYEVTQAQYSSVMGRNPSFFLGAERPVEQVSFKEITAPGGFLDKLNRYLAANGYPGWTADLPTNDEWEYAARAGIDASFHNGQQIQSRLSDPHLDEIAIYLSNKTGPAGRLAPNEWGLYDTLGNVFEWTREGDLRGGSFKQDAARTRLAYRFTGKSHVSGSAKDANQFGFRLVLRPPIQ